MSRGEVQKIKRELEAAGYNVETTPRGKMGWPCFHCGVSLGSCRKKKCCKKCRGLRSH